MKEIDKQITVGKILNQDNINKAIEIVVKRGGKPGADGIKPCDLKEYWEENGTAIMDSIISMKYEPDIANQFEQLNRKGRRRKFTLLNTVDRMIARAVSQVLSVCLDDSFSERCYSYRLGRGTIDVARFAARQIELGYEWVVELDIKNFFDSIPHEELLAKIQFLVEDECVRHLITSFVSCRIQTEEGQFRMAKGILMGSSLSPLLSNIYLMNMDKQFEDTFQGYARYGDDIKIFVRTQAEGIAIIEKCKNCIRNEKLTVNEAKCGVYRAINRPCLGVELHKKDGHVLIQPKEQNTKIIYSQWKSSALKEIDHNYHIVNDGILTKKDFTLLFENEKEKKYLPVEVIDSLSIYSNVVFSSGFFEIAQKEGFSVNFINNYGNQIGRFVPQSWKRNIKTEMAQVQLLGDENRRLKLAKVFQNANIFNVRAVLRYYERRGNDKTIAGTIVDITEILKKVNQAKNIDKLMMYEALARQKYYQCFNAIMDRDGFKFEKRTRRPPQDALNAMISFGNTLLYTRFSNIIYQTSLDIRIGIIHSSFKRQESLNLDMADLFKPILVDRTIFTLVNRKMLNAKQDFEEKENGGVYMTSRGKRIFIKEFEKKLSQQLTEKGTKMNYIEIMRREVRKVELYFRNNIPYKPYKYVN